MLLGTASLVLSFGSISLMNLAATAQMARVRKAYIESLLRQEMAFFDVNSADVASRLNE
jgi:ABC-type multidrug transport system fused ATPase/permease subunit